MDYLQRLFQHYEKGKVPARGGRPSGLSSEVCQDSADLATPHAQL